MSDKIFFGRTTGQVPDQSSKHPETACMVFTGTPWEWLCPKWSPHRSLKQISKENVRLFCSGSVICHTKRLSCTSGDVSCTLCRTDLLPAGMPVLSMQLSPRTVYPPLSAHFSCTPVLLSNFCCKLQQSIYHSVRLKCLSSAYGFYTATDSSQFLFRDKILYFQRGTALQRRLLMCSRPGIHRAFCDSLCDMDKNENNF